jgi:membrane-associated phospholipid phosphatase
MKQISRSINHNPRYFTAYIFFAIFISTYCLLAGKSEGFLLINHYHNKILDNFFILFTNVGNGIFAILVMLFMLILKKYGCTLQIALSFLVSGFLVQVLKHLVHSPRPKLFFGPGAIHCIGGITCTGYSSFPSGHTATIFALTTLFSFYFPGKKTGIYLILIAVLTGFSRVYLSQHFPVDVLAGSFLGVCVSVICYRFIPLTKLEKKYSLEDLDHQSFKLR